MLALVAVEVFRACEAVRQAGDPVHDFLGSPDIVEVADVTADAEDLTGSGEQRVIGRGGADGAALGTTVTTGVPDRAALYPVGVGARQCGVRGGERVRLIPLEGEDVVGVEVFGNQARRFLVGMQ